MSTLKALGNIYTAEWFAHDFADLRNEFNVVARAIYRQFEPRVAIDVGCGPGMVVEELRNLGVAAVGYEGSEYGIAYASERVRPHLAHADVTELPKLNQLGRIGVVICTEVAEHLEERHAARLVALLASALAPIVFTAAPPGQDGHHHVNCRPKDYWRDLFRSHGAFEDEAASEELRRRWGGLQRLSHMVGNVMVIR